MDTGTGMESVDVSDSGEEENLALETNGNVKGLQTQMQTQILDQEEKKELRISHTLVSVTENQKQEMKKKSQEVVEPELDLKMFAEIKALEFLSSSKFAQNLVAQSFGHAWIQICKDALNHSAVDSIVQTLCANCLNRILLGVRQFSAQYSSETENPQGFPTDLTTEVRFLLELDSNQVLPGNAHLIQESFEDLKIRLRGILIADDALISVSSTASKLKQISKLEANEIVNGSVQEIFVENDLDFNSEEASDWHRKLKEMLSGFDTVDKFESAVFGLRANLCFESIAILKSLIRIVESDDPCLLSPWLLRVVKQSEDLKRELFEEINEQECTVEEESKSVSDEEGSRVLELAKVGSSEEKVIAHEKPNKANSNKHQLVVQNEISSEAEYSDEIEERNKQKAQKRKTEKARKIEQTKDKSKPKEENLRIRKSGRKEKTKSKRRAKSESNLDSSSSESCSSESSSSTEVRRKRRKASRKHHKKDMDRRLKYELELALLQKKIKKLEKMKAERSERSSSSDHSDDTIPKRKRHKSKLKVKQQSPVRKQRKKKAHSLETSSPDNSENDSELVESVQQRKKRDQYQLNARGKEDTAKPSKSRRQGHKRRKISASEDDDEERAKVERSQRGKKESLSEVDESLSPEPEPRKKVAPYKKAKDKGREMRWESDLRADLDTDDDDSENPVSDEESGLPSEYKKPKSARLVFPKRTTFPERLERERQLTNKGKQRLRYPWSPAEDAALTKGISLYGFGNWAKILREYEFHPSRTSVKLKDRARTLNLLE